MHDDQKGFLEEIQSLSEGAKKRVLIIGTALVMIIIVGVWAIYFNSIFSGPSSLAAQDADTATTTAAATPAPAPIAVVATATPSGLATVSANGPGLWQNIGDGFGSIARFFSWIFNRPSNYAVQPK